jgi:zinc and cadmium transporter
MTEIRLTAIYCALIVLSSLAGGWFPRWFQLTHSRMQMALSFVAGVVLGIGLLHLLPHGYHEWSEVDSALAIDRSVLWLLAGFLGMFLLQRTFHFHSHEAPDELIDGRRSDDQSAAAQDFGHRSHGHAGHGAACSAQHQPFTWAGVFLGLTVHSLVDGMTLAAVIAAEWEHEHATLWAGFGYFLAVWLHKPLDSLSITSLMIAANWSRGSRMLVNCGYALVTPLGAALFYLGLQGAEGSGAAVLGATLCFAAGACVCIASSDLLPELQFHSHDRLKLSAALVVGLALAWGLVFVESQGHGHHESHRHGASAQNVKE